MRELPADERLWQRHEVLAEYRKLQAREDTLITSLAELQKENRIMGEMLAESERLLAECTPEIGGLT